MEILSIEENNEPAPSYLAPYLQSGNLNFLIGSGASAPAISTAGNIEEEINDLLAANKEAQANQKCFDFINAISSVNSKIAVSFGPAMGKVGKVKRSYADFVAAIDRILFARKSTLLPRQATIFTTNYDLFLEHSASRTPGIILNDGFDRLPGGQAHFPFAPERYFDRTYRSGPLYSHQIEIPTINLIKMHGSLSWRKHQGTVVYDLRPIPTLSPGEQGDSDKVRAYLEKHFLILPNLRKFHSTLMERIYYDLLRIFSKALDQPNVVLFSFGFSFADEHILDITRRALRNPTSQLIIFAYDHASSTTYEEKFSRQRNVTVISPQASSVLDFSRLNKILSSILPANTYAATA